MSLVLLPAQAVILSFTDNPDYNTSAPTGTLAGSGWDLQGIWGSFLGTPIAPRYFLAAKHVGGTPGDVFTLNGVDFHTIAFYDSPNSDLRIWKVAETFPAYAPLYTATNEVGSSLVVFGRGTQRGAAVIVSGHTNGWKWGVADQRRRWGENVVSATVDFNGVSGALLKAEFNRTGGPINEAHLSTGDSSGAVFLQESNVWKLAGINYSVDGYFSTDGTTNTQFDAALLDMGGLWIGSGTNWTYIFNTLQDKPSSFYATRVSQFADWIRSVTDNEIGPDLRLELAILSNQVAVLSFPSASNRLYRIQYSSDLRSNSWQALTNDIAGTGQVIEVQDPASPGEPCRFYRLQLLR